MAITSTLRVVGQIQGLVSGNLDFEFTATSSLGRVDTIDLNPGANTITVPSTSYTHVILAPPSGNSANITTKGVSGDTGVANSVSKFKIETLSSLASFVMSASASVTGLTAIWM
jgi:hypothetical protein